MNNEKFTNATQELINHAINIAVAQQNPTLLPLHLLAAGLENEFCDSFFSVLELSTAELGSLVSREMAKLPKVSGAQLCLARFFTGLPERGRKTWG
jgi:hypothetical protein